MPGLRMPNADQAMLLSGGKTSEGAPFEVVLGRRRWVFLRKVAFLTLEQQQHKIGEDCFTKEKIPVRIVATIAFKIPANEKSVIDAGQRFLANQSLMPAAVGNITAGALRGIVGEMTLEQIIGDRTTLQTKVLEHAKEELAPQGLQVDSLNISSIEDLSPGASAIESLSTPHLAEIRRDASIAQAKANAQAAQAEQTAAQQQADYERQTEVTKAGYAAEVAQANASRDAAIAAANAERDQKSKVAQAMAEAEVGKANAERDRLQRVAQANADAETGEAQARASQAGPLATAKAQHDVAVAATSLAEQQALQKTQELRRDVVAPAEAQKEATIAAAEAEAEAIRRKAEAAATEGRVSLDQRIVEQLPAIAAAVSDGIRGSNLTILNGTEGLSEVATGLISQIGAIYDVARSLRSAGTNGHVPAENVPTIPTEVQR